MAEKVVAKKETPVVSPPAPIKEEPAAPVINTTAIFLVLHPNGETQKILDLLKNHPALHLTLLFPPHYFDDPARRALIPSFAIMQSSRQIEAALTLDNEPNLPLLADLGEAGEKVDKWGFTFRWPDDVAAQIARASGKYQKRWSALPAGFYPPNMDLTEAVVQMLKKFRLNWTIGRPGQSSGIKFFGATALLIPPVPPVIDEPTGGSKLWADQTAEWALKQPFALVDTTQLEDPRADISFLEALVKKNSGTPAKILLTGQAFTEGLKNEFELPSGANPFKNDYSAWVNTPQQKRAWAALADARAVIDSYQRSGHANLQRLDAAVEEMCSAESGPFLRDSGQNASSARTLGEQTPGERNFLATLGNIYRLCDAQVPSNLNTWFAARTWQKSNTNSFQNQSDGPFFVEGPQSLTWNDPRGDDSGAGKYVYPTGSIPKGLFDLKEVSVTWTDTDVTFSAGVLAPLTGKQSPIVPLIDIYIDVNRLPDAGSTSALRRRGPTSLLREAAWEYALNFSPNTAVLYQAVPGGAPRVISIQPATAQGNNMFVTISRKTLRGDPKHWRLSVGLMGTENSRRLEEMTPVSILANPTEKNFGGASSGQAAPYIDLLDSSIESQANRIGVNVSGGPLTLPFVEGQ